MATQRDDFSPLLCLSVPFSTCLLKFQFQDILPAEAQQPLLCQVRAAALGFESLGAALLIVCCGRRVVAQAKPQNQPAKEETKKAASESIAFFVFPAFFQKKRRRKRHQLSCDLPPRWLATKPACIRGAIILVLCNGQGAQ